jgi:glycine cleavage system aminomethyltransferase T
MTQIDLASPTQATPFALLMESAATPHELAVYRGVQTPRLLDAPTAESAALATGAACHDLGWLRRVEVRGEDRFRWLSGMVTNTVNDLGDHCRRVEPGSECAGAHSGRPHGLARG